jgi:hypothetical protein
MIGANVLTIAMDVCEITPATTAKILQNPAQKVIFLAAKYVKTLVTLAQIKKPVIMQIQ